MSAAKILLLPLHIKYISYFWKQFQNSNQDFFYLNQYNSGYTPMIIYMAILLQKHNKNHRTIFRLNIVIFKLPRYLDIQVRIIQLLNINFKIEKLKLDKKSVYFYKKTRLIFAYADGFCNKMAKIMIIGVYTNTIELKMVYL